jgi:cytochrome P450
MSLAFQVDRAWFLAQMGSRALWERVSTGMRFNPLLPELRSNPHPFYRELRERDPFHRCHPADGWVLSRYDDVLAVLSDRDFSADERNQTRYPRLQRLNRLAGLPDPYETGLVSILRMDPPDHTRLRSLVNKAFTPRAIDRLKTRIESLVDELLTPLAKRARADLVAEFAAPLPVVVIAELIGVPAEDRDRFRAWSDDVVRLLGDGTLESKHEGERARRELVGYFEAIVAERRAAPRDDLVSELVAAEEDGNRLAGQELYSILTLLLVAGNETTTKLIGNSLLALLRNQSQLELLREEPKRIGDAVEELLRYDGPVQLTSRIATRDCELRGHSIRRGQQIVLLLAAANRDPAQFESPDRLDVTRREIRHLAFGHGTHFCLGARLARLETTVALEALISRFPNLRECNERVEWSPNTVLRGPTRLPLAL